MVQIIASKSDRSVGLTWSRCGWAILVLTIVTVVYVWLHEPLPPEGMFFLLFLGGIPATLCFSVAIFRCLQARRSNSQGVSRWIEWKGLRQSAGGLLFLLFSASALGLACFVQARVEEKWVSDAESVVAEYLGDADNLHPYPTTPGGNPPDLGRFIELSGEGYHGASWNIQGYEYLIANRMGRFKNGELPVTIVVAEGAKVAPASKEVFVKGDEWGTGIQEGTFGQKLIIYVAHPGLH